jgi:hypothetical protein
MLTMPNRYDYLILISLVLALVAGVFIINAVYGPTCPPC